MAKYNKGILGRFTGLVGSVVGSRWRGIDIMRSKPDFSSSKSTTAQQVQRARFLVVANFIGSMKTLFPISYRETTGQMTPVNSAVSAILKNAVTGVYPDFKVDPSLVLVAKGGIPNAMDIVPIVAADASIVNFQWLDNTNTGSAKAGDKAILVAYCEELNQSVYTIGAALRSDGRASLSLISFKGRKVHTWLAFLAENGKDTASSVYTGSVTVS